MGDPATRDPALVARNWRNRLVSCDVALDIYKVALTETGAVDETKTQELRHAL